VAAVLGPGGPSTATKTCRRWSGGTDFGGTIHGMSGHLVIRENNILVNPRKFFIL